MATWVLLFCFLVSFPFMVYLFALGKLDCLDIGWAGLGLVIYVLIYAYVGLALKIFFYIIN